MGLDETSLSGGELYTILINKEAKGRKGSIIAMIKGTDVKTVCGVLLKLSRKRRFQVREITLDMASNMHHIFENGDTRKQLLARARYLLFKKDTCWSDSQSKRAAILFREYPDIKKAYYLSLRLGLIYHQCKHADTAMTRLARWYDGVDKSGFQAFGTVARTLQTHYLRIVAFFKNRATNAASESFNARIKAFRAQLRGVRDTAFFLFRLSKIYA